MIEMHIFHGQRTREWNWNSVLCDHFFFRLMKCRRNTYNIQRNCSFFSATRIWCKYTKNTYNLQLTVHVSQKMGNFHRIITTIHLRQQFWINVSNESQFIWCLISIKFIPKGWHFLLGGHLSNGGSKSKWNVTVTDDSKRRYLTFRVFVYVYQNSNRNQSNRFNLPSIWTKTRRNGKIFCTIK